MAAKAGAKADAKPGAVAEITREELWRRFGGVQAREATLTERERGLNDRERGLNEREVAAARLEGELSQQRLSLESYERQLTADRVALEQRQAAFLTALQRLGLGVAGSGPSGGKGGGPSGCKGLAQPVPAGMVLTGRRVRHRGRGGGEGGSDSGHSGGHGGGGCSG